MIFKISVAPCALLLAAVASPALAQTTQLVALSLQIEKGVEGRSASENFGLSC